MSCSIQHAVARTLANAMGAVQLSRLYSIREAVRLLFQHTKWVPHTEYSLLRMFIWHFGGTSTSWGCGASDKNPIGLATIMETTWQRR